MNTTKQICRYSKRLAIPAAVAAIASGCAVAGDPAGAPLSGGIPWHHAHPILVNFTAGLVPISFICDLLGKITRRESLSSAGWWTIIFAALLTPLTALSGYFWKAEIPSEALPADLIFTHQYLGIAVAAALSGLALWRGLTFYSGRRPAVLYLFVTAITVGTLAYQGNIGGTMVFG